MLFTLCCGTTLLAAPGDVASPSASATPAPSVAQAPAPSKPANEIPTESRRLVLETAGAFTNDGFRIRDGEWSLSLEKGVPRFLQVTLFAGNRYWFVAASPAATARLRITVYDAEGRVVKGEQWQDPEGRGRSAAGVAPGQSGQYFVGVEVMEAPVGAALETCLVVAYK